MDESQTTESIEKIFGRFRAPVREGRVTTILVCSGLVFGINLLGSVLNTLSSVFLVPVCFHLGIGGWIQGVSLAQLQATSCFSLLFIMVLRYGLSNLVQAHRIKKSYGPKEARRI